MLGIMLVVVDFKDDVVKVFYVCFGFVLLCNNDLCMYIFFKLIKDFLKNVVVCDD